jgi:choice-of-anchor A domain-containing protein
VASLRFLPVSLSFVVATLLGGLPASASLLTAYNVVVTGNFNASVHVEGATFVGGNLHSSVMSEFNHKGTTPDGYSGLRVGGTISGTLKVMHGETVEYGNKAAGASIDCGGGNCETAGVDLSAERDDLAAQMAALSAAYAGLSANGTYGSNKLTYAGSDSTAVFSVSASDLFFQNANLELALGSATHAIINVYGNVDVFNTNLTGSWNASNVLWNFVDATEVNFKDMAVKGTVLAPNAEVRNSAGFDGSLWAAAYTNTTLREIHDYPWTGDVPPPPVEEEDEFPLPEPTLLTLALAGVGFVAARARRTQR